MSPKHSEIVPNVFPFLRYQDAPRAIQWLTEAFGFEKQAVYPGPEGTIAHAQLRVGPGVIMLSSSRKDALGMESAPELGGVSQGVYIALRDVDAHYARSQAAGATIVRPIENTDYGSREYTAKDPEGNLWSFGTYVPGADSGT
jgi:uncharacterized glyoxalase superfamily protein PhnB